MLVASAGLLGGLAASCSSQGPDPFSRPIWRVARADDVVRRSGTAEGYQIDVYEAVCDVGSGNSDRATYTIRDVPPDQMDALTADLIATAHKVGWTDIVADERPNAGPFLEKGMAEGSRAVLTFHERGPDLALEFSHTPDDC